MTAYPPRTRWFIETYFPSTSRWGVVGDPLESRAAATSERVRLSQDEAAWPDGTPVQRRIVLETTTFEDMDADPAARIGHLPNGGFVLPCVGGQDFAAVPGKTPDGRPAIRFTVGSSNTGHAEAVVPLELLEEIVAGQRDIARQAGDSGPVCPHRHCGSLSLPTNSGEVVHCVLLAEHAGQCQSAIEYPYVSWPNPSNGVWNPTSAQTTPAAEGAGA